MFCVVLSRSFEISGHYDFSKHVEEMCVRGARNCLLRSGGMIVSTLSGRG